MATFKHISPALILALLFDCSCSTKADNSKQVDNIKVADIIQKDTLFNGLYAGLEYMGITTDPVYPGKKFNSYHLGYLKIKGDSAFLDQSPIFVYKRDTSYSASDGGFYYYSGTLQKNDTTVLFNLNELFCDYCGTLVKTNPNGTHEVIKRKKQLKGRLTDKGFIIDGYLYARTTKKEDLLSEHPETYLKSK
jgi:hypothetical protein